MGLKTNRTHLVWILQRRKHLRTLNDAAPDARWQYREHARDPYGRVAGRDTFKYRGDGLRRSVRPDYRQDRDSDGQRLRLRALRMRRDDAANRCGKRIWVTCILGERFDDLGVHFDGDDDLLPVYGHRYAAVRTITDRRSLLRGLSGIRQRDAKNGYGDPSEV